MSTVQGTNCEAVMHYSDSADDKKQGARLLKQRTDVFTPKLCIGFQEVWKNKFLWLAFLGAERKITSQPKLISTVWVEKKTKQNTEQTVNTINRINLLFPGCLRQETQFKLPVHTSNTLKCTERLVPSS